MDKFEIFVCKPPPPAATSNKPRAPTAKQQANPPAATGGAKQMCSEARVPSRRGRRRQQANLCTCDVLLPDLSPVRVRCYPAEVPTAKPSTQSVFDPKIFFDDFYLVCAAEVPTATTGKVRGLDFPTVVVAMWGDQGLFACSARAHLVPIEYQRGNEKSTRELRKVSSHHAIEPHCVSTRG